MAVTRALVEHVARLARLRLDDAEIERLTGELNGILVHVDELVEADVAGVDAVGGVADGPAVLRADEPGADPLASPPSELTPGWLDGFFTVPRLAALGGGDDE
jgi:aspartyl-tRNA(Asn)/glutamyl-tRNA(Gln) amidotransferase subunit C